MIKNMEPLLLTFSVLSEESEYGFIHNYKKEVFEEIGVKSPLQMFNSIQRDDISDIGFDTKIRE